jgi:adenylate kinase family enzyme
VISGGALLEDQHFHIAQAILADHIRKNHIDKNSSIILNGLPRHPGQARDIKNQIEVINIINLHCSPQTVFQRIYANSGGDRTDRPDDTRDLIAAKLKIFDERTRPLLQYYAQQKVPITTITVTTKSTPQEIWEKFLEQSSSPHQL